MPADQVQTTCLLPACLQMQSGDLDRPSTFRRSLDTGDRVKRSQHPSQEDQVCS